MDVVSDTGPLNYLVLTTEIEWLELMFPRVFVPAAVLTELMHPRSPAAVRAWVGRLPPFVEAVASGEDELTGLTPGLGRGERAALSVAAGRGLRLLTDDRKAYLAAKRLGLEPVGTLGLMIRAAELGHTDLARAFNALDATNFHWPAGLKDVLLAQAGLSG